MADDPELPEDEEEDQETLPSDTLYFAWQGGDLVILDIAGFADRFKTLALRTVFKTGELEVLEEDGKRWKKLGRALKAVESK